MLDERREVRLGKTYSAAQRFLHPQALMGRATVPALMCVVIVAAVLLLTLFQVRVPQAHADDVSTSLTVLNTPPAWTTDAAEVTASATTTPTNAGSVLSFTAKGTDSSNDNYWLIICSASSTPTAGTNAPPQCGAGAFQWAISATTTSGTFATAATTTLATAPFQNESNAWYGYICDGNPSGGECNPAMTNDGAGTPSAASPFVINHPPIFSAISNNSPQNPGGTLTWTATAHDTDVIRGGDTVKLTVCKANDYIAASSTCGAGGTWAQSTFSASNPATSTTISIPAQDKTYNAFVYITDQNNLVATSTFEASASNFVVNNVAPTVETSSITLVDTATASTTGFITLVTPSATSGPYQVHFTANDNNGCQNASSGNEMVSATTTIYLSAVGQASCQLAAQSNPNSCYPSSDPATQITCTQDVGSCSGPSDTSSTWTCNFSLWYNADPTVTGTPYSSDSWLASTQVQDDNGALSPETQALTGNSVDSFLAFDVTQSSISYGGLQPGQKNDPLATTTNLIEEGNVGLDEDLYGDTMCTTWTTPDSCDAGGPDATRKIPVSNQEFATSSVSFASGVPLTSSSSPSLLGIHVPKTTATSSPQAKNTYWGANVPIAITVAGNYKGQNTIIATESSSTNW